MSGNFIGEAVLHEYAPIIITTIISQLLKGLGIDSSSLPPQLDSSSWVRNDLARYCTHCFTSPLCCSPARGEREVLQDICYQDQTAMDGHICR